MHNQKNNQFLYALRGATTCEKNSLDEISFAVEELLSELIKRNKLVPAEIVSITFSVTKDLDACFPASIARKREGWDNVALLDCQQMYVPEDLNKCIRILAHVFLKDDENPQHVYLGNAKKLRPDR